MLLYFCAVPRFNHLLRGLPPLVVQAGAVLHDQQIIDTFCTLFGIGDESSWCAQLHGVTRSTCLRQAKLPLRFAGCGLRDSTRVSHAAYWSSWADCVSVLQNRFLETSARILASLNRCEKQGHAVPFCIQAAVEAGRHCEEVGWDAKPAWQELHNGLRPPQPDQNESCLGEWAHGWQFHASSAVENAEFEALLVTLALPSTRRNAAAQGKARIHSCRGPFASSWLTVCPTSEQLHLKDSLLSCAVRRRLGLAVCYQGPDAHGYRRLADNTGARLNVRHTALIAAWRQVFVEAGGQVPDRNIERLLRNSHVPVSPDDLRRLDILVPGLNVDRGRPLFCDATVVNIFVLGNHF